MEEEQWQRIKEIVADALELPTAERSDFAQKACEADTALLERVLVYLDRARSDTTFLNEPIFSVHKQPKGGAVGSWSGHQVGSFLLEDLLGHGGMGAVYLGKHVDGLYDQDVAVKVLHPELDSGRFIRRLERERSVLNSLIHPYIARFLEGGNTSNGLPFIAMQRVDGLPIDVYCDRERLSIPERIKLFMRVCAAVQFAHQKLVVHCDLKPTNILVTPEGQPQLLDFGIAKIVGDDLSQSETSHIRHQYLTPLYASPEQFRGEELTTAVDIYALGLLLYQLLTGQAAHRPDGEARGSMRMAVCESIPPLPSRIVKEVDEYATRDFSGNPESPMATDDLRASARRQSRLLVGDLDSIVMKALEKQPGKRYSSVEAFVDDLRLHLDDRPVLARPRSPRYVVGKFLRRNIGAVAAATLLLCFALWMAVQALEIARQNRLLERKNIEITRERDRATEVREFLVEFLRVPDPSRSAGSALTVQEALHAAALQLQSNLRDEPEVRAELLDAIGRVYTNLGLYSDAEPLLKDALETRREALGSQHPQVAASLHNLAFLKRRVDQAVEAEALRRKAIVIQRRAFPHGDPALALGLNGLASLLRKKRALDEAESVAEEALAMQIRFLGDRDLDVAFTLNTLASVSRLRGDLTRAAALYRQSLDIRRDHKGPVDSGIAAVLNNLALVLVELEELSEAINIHREALAIRDQIYTDDHPRRITSLNNLAIALSLHDEHPEALAVIEEAIAMHERLEGSLKRGTVLQLNRASILEHQGSTKLCLEAIEPVLVDLASNGKASRIADARSIQGGCLSRAGFFDAAEPILLSSYYHLDELLGSHARQTRQARNRIDLLYKTWGRPELAQSFNSPAPK